MGQTVYADLFFMINFSMDFLCLFLTAKILGRPPRPGRHLAGAALGGLYAVLALLLPVGPGAALLIDGAVCALLCAVAFGERRRWRSLPLYILVFVAVSMALGGFMTALFHLLNRSSLFADVETVEGDGLSVWIFALLALVSGAITLLGGRFFTRRASRTHAGVEVCYGGRSLRLEALTDSGNLLREPISGRPCIVADIGVMERLLPREIICAARAARGAAPEQVSPAHAKNLRLIPTRTASGEGMLLGVRMERVTVLADGRSHEVDALIALAELGASAEGRDALLPSGLLI